jgi:WD40-like Beta Propeller Repeat
MSIDERGSEAAQGLRDRLADDLPSAQMLESLHRTRARRRLALASSAVVAVLAVAATATVVPTHRSASPAGPGPSAPTSTAPVVQHANGVLFGYGANRLVSHAGLHLPPLRIDSSPTWSPDGAQVAVLAGGILVTDVHTGTTRTLPCPGCAQISWSPDGQTFAAATTGKGSSPLLLVDATTGEATAMPLPGFSTISSPTWAPDSQRLAFLAVAPVARQGAWTVGLDGSPAQQFVRHHTVPGLDAHDATILAIRWSPTRASIAVLFATPSGDPRTPTNNALRLDAHTMHPDGSAETEVVHDGSCACVGWAPDLVWSPDGRTLMLSSLHRRAAVNRIDGDGNPIRVAFAAGASGVLSWQPLPPSR